MMSDFSRHLILPFSLCPRGEGQMACTADSLTVICELMIQKNVEASTSQNPMGP
jgi:hypothetical protein